MKRSQMMPSEREWRAKLSKMIHWTEYLRGTLCIRKGMCGKPGCKCTRGEKHVHLVLQRSDAKRIRQLYIPRAMEKRVRRSLKEYRTIKELLEKICRLQWRKLEEERAKEG